MNEEQEKREEESAEAKLKSPPSDSRDYDISESELKDGKAMAILAYVIFIVPLLAARENKFAMYHTEQGLVLALLWIGNLIVTSILSFLCIGFIIGPIISVVLLVYHIIGIVNVVQQDLKPLPLIGEWGHKLMLIKD